MRTVGQILKEVRESKFYSLDEIEKATKIRKDLLHFLESDQYEKLPPPTFVQGFIKLYGRFLSLDTQKLLAVYRREFQEGKHKPYVMDAFSKPLSNKLKITPSRVLTLLLAFIIFSFFGYLYFQYQQFSGTPILEVTEPQDQQTVQVESFLVSGRSELESKVTVNGVDVGLDTEGRFSQVVNLSQPVNKIIITSISKFGRKTQIERIVYLKK